MSEKGGGIGLALLPGQFALCRLPPNDTLPAWVDAAASFLSITRTDDECSIMAPTAIVPEAASVVRDYRALKVDGPIPLDAVGILAALSTALARANVTVFPIATHDTDYLFIRAADLAAAMSALREAKHVVTP